jgi:hypothetical protein
MKKNPKVKIGDIVKCACESGCKAPLCRVIGISDEEIDVCPLTGPDEFFTCFKSWKKANNYYNPVGEELLREVLLD